MENAADLYAALAADGAAEVIAPDAESLTAAIAHRRDALRAGMLLQQRIEADIAAREQTGRSSLLADESLLAALDAGLPPCAGVAVGMERLHMVLDQAEDIRDVITFATETS